MSEKRTYDWKPSRGLDINIEKLLLQRASGRGPPRTIGGRKGESYDNALAETINGLHKTELIHCRAPCESRIVVELATLELVD